MARLIPDTIRIKGKDVPVSFLLTKVGDVRFWVSQPTSARMAMIDILNRIKYGRAAATGKVKRVLQVVKLRKS